jgi:hypothetical protein
MPLIVIYRSGNKAVKQIMFQNLKREGGDETTNSSADADP